MAQAPQKLRKRDITRARVIQAAIDCIYDEGFHAANTNRIAEHAGVSWGVLQYHFGDKDGLLQAVLDTIFQTFTDTLSSADVQQASLEPRLRALIACLWSLVSQREYRVSVAILRNAGRSQDSRLDGSAYLEQWANEIATLWDSLLVDLLERPRNSDAARRLLFAALRGLADDINPRATDQGRNLKKELDALAVAIHYLLVQ